ncbi:peptide-methionine (S)-S-oxide reductase MsrA [Desulfovibrio subterraneus]|uniref:Peptide methionine sulfoxide reductase MsrA n=1 Tax=Desulfovibrio subterraneus TaxID=2718620 RepID=A0A7J0BJY8_9BACT|nr:peptide-methionine (S)-S-oxide reductase MsrA [Desulfovibrio subterraneus]WBF67704.1 peptide-methionine (S)-S-oxide reductase MsrA [Desulfovibrio subterraneus]GFM33541.1 peptide methionine sulfoxide reductase MsrA [Desulfovibrio subterraneus]
MNISLTVLGATLFATTLLLVGRPAPVRAEDASGNMAVATFAGGCFWCMEPPFDALEGVISTTSGYTGGHKDNPAYKEVSAGTTGHLEALQITYDPAKVSYETLLDVFWKNIDPLDPYGQFCDKGEQYRAAIFYHTDEQRLAAEASKAALISSDRLNGTVETRIIQASTFWPAEEYHQDYYKKNPIRYKFYRHNCGRDKRLKQLWGTE